METIMTKYIFTALLSLTLSTQMHASSPVEKLDGKINTLRTFFVQQADSISRSKQGYKDVHAFNAEIKPLAAILIECNSILCDAVNHQPTIVLDGLSQLRKSCGFADEYDLEITNLRAYLTKGNDLDKETGMHVSHMLSAIWNYIQVAQDARHRYDMLGRVFFYLKQNTLESGGCFPGYAGRLMVVNGLLATQRHDILMKELHDARLISLLTPAQPTEHMEMSEEEQVRLAIAMSQPPQAPTAPVEMSEEELQLYLAMAMSNDEK